MLEDSPFAPVAWNIKVYLESSVAIELGFFVKQDMRRDIIMYMYIYIYIYSSAMRRFTYGRGGVSNIINYYCLD